MLNIQKFTSNNFSKVLKVWTVEVSLNRYIQVVVKQYPASPQLYVQFTLFKKNFNTGKYCIAKTLTTKMTELELAPFKTIVDNEFNFPDYTLNGALPSNENGANYFDYVLDVEDRGASLNKRILRLGFKSYNNVSHVFVKLFLWQNEQWNRYQDMNFTLPEFRTIYELIMLTHLDSLRHLQRRGRIPTWVATTNQENDPHYQIAVFDSFNTNAHPINSSLEDSKKVPTG